MKNVPNILSALRIALVPVFVLAYFKQEENVKSWAAAVYAFASVTDFLDGYIARKYNFVSNLGKVLDPVGDKLMTITALACITVDRVIPVWAVAAVVVKETLMLAGGAILRKKEGGQVPSANIVGKTSTVVFFVVCVTLMLFKDIPGKTATAMVLAAIVLMVAALASYAMTFVKTVRKAGGLKFDRGV